MAEITQKLDDQYEKKSLPLFNKLDEMHHLSHQGHMHKGDKVNESHVGNISKQWHADAVQEGISILFYGMTFVFAWLKLLEPYKVEPSIIAQFGQGIAQMAGNIDKSEFFQSEQQKYAHIEQVCQMQEQQAKDYQRLIDQQVQQTESIINNIAAEEKLLNSNS